MAGSAEPVTERRSASNPIEVPEGTLVDLFLNAIVMDQPSAQLWRTEAGWQKISHAEMFERVREIAAALRSYGVERGDRVGILSENMPEWAWADYAILCAGAVTVPVYPTLPSNQAAYILKHAACRTLFVSTAEQLEKVLEARPELPELERIIVFDDVDHDDAGVIRLSAVLEAGRAANWSADEFRIEARRAQPHDLATIVYTSGTTGTPKGVMLTHNNIHSNVLAAMKHVLQSGPDDMTLSFLPLSHVFQRMVDYLMFAGGTPIAYVPVMDQVGPALREVMPTIVVAAPRVYEKVYEKILSAKGIKRKLVLWARQVAIDHSEQTLAGKTPSAGLRLQHQLADRIVFSKVRATMGGHIRFFVSGSAPLNPQIAHFFRGAGILILEGYGLTETSPVITVNTTTALRIGTVGTLIPSTEVRIADDGEILIRGPQVMKGYYRNDEATAAMIDDDGWLHTGDIGAIDADGFLTITDRKKELLVTAGGKNVAPQPIQNAARASRFIAESVLIGDRRPYTILLVVPNFDVLETWARQQGMTWSDHEELTGDARVREKLEQEVTARLDGFARYEVPKKVLPLPREFSLDRGEITPSLKVKRRVVEEAYSDRIEALYAEPAPDKGR